MAELDSIVRKLNGDYLELLHSREYKTGKRICRWVDAIKSRDIGWVFEWPHRKRKAQIMRALCTPNRVGLTCNEMPEVDKVAVYTCVTGEYDSFKEPLIRHPMADFFAFSDIPASGDGEWIHIMIDSVVDVPRGLDVIRRARWFKTHPHLLFPEYQYSIWIDGSMQPIGDVTRFLRCLGREVPFATNLHPSRDCIYKEAEACAILGKDNPALMQAQIAAYKSEGMPSSFGLPETNVIARKHHDAQCIALMEAWWNEIVRWSYRDQLSLPYVMWKNGYSMKSIGFISADVRKETRLRWEKHA